MLLIARSPDAAAWLSAAFRDGSSGGDGSNSSGSSRGSSRQGRTPEPVPASIRKTYWAVVARSSSDGSSSAIGASAGKWLPRAGTVSLPVPSSRDPGQLQEALTRYRVLHESEDAGLAWLQLQPSTGGRALTGGECAVALTVSLGRQRRPRQLTAGAPAHCSAGRKHQLRLHCARGLGAPVLGDARYGAVRSAAQEAALAALERPGVKQAAAAFGGSGAGAPLFLHCRSLEVKQPGARRGAVAVTAPLPPTWRTLLQQQGWPSAGD